MPEQIPVVDVLNRLLTLHCRSLPRYLASAQPWFSTPDSESEAVLRHIAEDHQLMVDRIGAVIMDQGGAIQPSEFPIEFTDLHDLSGDYLIPLVEQRQRQEIDWIRQFADRLKGSPAARAIADEALGAAHAHVDCLCELTARPAST